jgi:hypothetical protein
LPIREFHHSRGWTAVVGSGGGEREERGTIRVDELDRTVGLRPCDGPGAVAPFHHGMIGATPVQRR